MDEALTAYCEKSGQNKKLFNVLIPSLSVKHILSVVEGQSAVFLSVDERHLLVQIGEKLVYTIVQGGAMGFPVAQVAQMESLPKETLIGVDSTVLDKGITFINKINAIAGEADSRPISIELKDGVLNAKSGAAGQINSAIKTLSVKGAENNICIAGKYLAAALRSLNKGNVVLGLIPGRTVTLYNGTVDAVDTGSYVIIALVRENQMPEPRKEEESEEAAE